MARASTLQSYATPRPSPASVPTIRIVVVESHQHALEHVHATLRRQERERSRRRRKKRSLVWCGGSGGDDGTNKEVPQNGGDRQIDDRERVGGGREANKTDSFQWSMIHVDSHPDLACPGNHVPAAACFLPRKLWPSSEKSLENMARRLGDDKSDENESANETDENRNLYELLDSTASGISEWILPLALAGGLRRVHWIKRRWCRQFRSTLVGEPYRYSVGAWIPEAGDSIPEKEREALDFLDLPCSARVKVDCRHPYYLDDAAVAPAEELLLKSELTLSVSDLDLNAVNCCKNIEPDDGTEDDEDWVLDICLDAFVCRNPFLSDVKNVKVEMALANLAHRVRFRNQYLSSCDSQIYVDEQKYKHERERFQKLMSRLLSSRIKSPSESGADAKMDAPNNKISEEDFETLHNLFTPPSLGRQLVSDLLEALGNKEGGGCESEKLCEEGKKSTAMETVCGERDPARLALDALPFIDSMPHPHPLGDVNHATSPSSQDLLRTASNGVTRLGEALRQCISISGISEEAPEKNDQPQPKVGRSFRRKPMLVTVARSAIDGFIPVDIVDNLQKEVIRMVHDLFCNEHCLVKRPDSLDELNCVVKEEDLSDPNPVFRLCDNCQVVYDYGVWEGLHIDY